MRGARFYARHKTTAGRFRALLGAVAAIGEMEMMFRNAILNALIIDGEGVKGQSLLDNECRNALNESFCPYKRLLMRHFQP